MKVPISLFNNVVVFYVAEQSMIKSGFRGWSGYTTYVKGKVFRFEESGSSDIDHAEAEKRYRKIRFRDSFSAFIFV